MRDLEMQGVGIFIRNHPQILVGFRKFKNKLKVHTEAASSLLVGSEVL